MEFYMNFRNSTIFWKLRRGKWNWKFQTGQRSHFSPQTGHPWRCGLLGMGLAQRLGPFSPALRPGRKESLAMVRRLNCGLAMPAISGEAPNWGHHDVEETTASPFCYNRAPGAHRKGGWWWCASSGGGDGRLWWTSGGWLLGVLQLHTKRGKLEPDVDWQNDGRRGHSPKMG
jgi:hypothetical protein